MRGTSGFRHQQPTDIAARQHATRAPSRIRYFGANTSSACEGRPAAATSKRISVAGAGMREGQAAGVQPLPGQPQPLGQHRVGAVGQVADAGVPDRGHVHPDLVRAAGLEVDIEQRRGPERLDRLVVGDARAAAGDHRELVVGARVPADRGVDGAAARIRMALDERGVALVDRRGRGRRA